jgi:hypothetical protein
MSVSPDRMKKRVNVENNNNLKLFIVVPVGHDRRQRFYGKNHDESGNLSMIPHV